MNIPTSTTFRPYSEITIRYETNLARRPIILLHTARGLFAFSRGASAPFLHESHNMEPLSYSEFTIS